jgi:hypothetical protein
MVNWESPSTTYAGTSEPRRSKIIRENCMLYLTDNDALKIKIRICHCPPAKNKDVDRRHLPTQPKLPTDGNHQNKNGQIQHKVSTTTAANVSTNV